MIRNQKLLALEYSSLLDFLNEATDIQQLSLTESELTHWISGYKFSDSLNEKDFLLINSSEFRKKLSENNSKITELNHKAELKREKNQLYLHKIFQDKIKKLIIKWNEFNNKIAFLNNQSFMIDYRFVCFSKLLKNIFPKIFI